MALFPYPGSAAMSLNNLSSLVGSDDDTKPKKPVLYRAGQAVGTGLNAAHQVAAAGDQAADQAISSGVDATKLGFANFVRGVQGKPSLSALPPQGAPANDSAPTGAPAAGALPNVLTQPSTPSLNIATAGTGVGNASTLSAPTASIDSGVTLPDGRKLPYGAQVNGVPTFSDGSGGPGAPPRTMTQADIQGLGARLNVVPASAFTQPAPAFNSDNTDANVQAILTSRQGSKFGITPEQNAASDLAAVTSQDPRSTLGLAAMNASRSANAASTTLQRKAALGGLANLQDAVAKNAMQSIADPAALARVNAEGQSSLQRQALANTGDLARQNLANTGDLARTDLAGQYDVAGRLAQGQTKATLTEKDLNAQAIKLLPQVLGLNAMGQIDDKTAPGGTRAATEQEIAGGLARAKAIIQGQLAPSSSKPSFDQFTTAVRANGSKMTDAQLRDYYNQHYGS